MGNYKRNSPTKQFRGGVDSGDGNDYQKHVAIYFLGCMHYISTSDIQSVKLQCNKGTLVDDIIITYSDHIEYISCKYRLPRVHGEYDRYKIMNYICPMYDYYLCHKSESIGIKNNYILYFSEGEGFFNEMFVEYTDQYYRNVGGGDSIIHQSITETSRVNKAFSYFVERLKEVHKGTISYEEPDKGNLLLYDVDKVYEAGLSRAGKEFPPYEPRYIHEFIKERFEAKNISEGLIQHFFDTQVGSTGNHFSKQMLALLCGKLKYNVINKELIKDFISSS